MAFAAASSVSSNACAAAPSALVAVIYALIFGSVPEGRTITPALPSSV